MPINVFDDPYPAATTSQEFVPAAPAGGTPTPPTSWARTFLVLLVALGLVAGGAYGVYQYREPSGTASTSPSSYLTKPQPMRPKGECIDASGSSGDHGALARLALTTTRNIVGRWTTRSAVPDSRPVAAQPGLSLTARVVQADSFGTSDSAAHTATVNIGSVDGLSDAAPLAQTPGYIDRSRLYREEHATVLRQLTRAKAGVRAGSAELQRLIGQGSSGSDVTGCVLALAGILGPNSDIFVVSDLEDTRFTAPRDARLTGSMKGVRLWIAQACPSGLPQACQAQQRAFISRLTPLGLHKSAVTTVRPENTVGAVHDWLGR
jgi:hypothetical protein